VSSPIALTTPPAPPRRAGLVVPEHQPDRLRIVPWVDPVADPHGVHPCSRYVELYWLGIIGPSTTWLLRRLNYGLEVHGNGYDLHLPETARALGLGDKMGKNSPFRRALARLITFELARAQGPGELAVRAHIPPLPLRHLSRLPESLQRSHRRWLAEQQLSQPEQMRRRAIRLATGLAQSGHDRETIEQRLGEWQFHPSVAFHAAGVASGGPIPSATECAPASPAASMPLAPPVHADAPPRAVRPVRPMFPDLPVQSSAPDLPEPTTQPGSASWPAGVRPQ
jgi:hypothetical protein